MKILNVIPYSPVPAVFGGALRVYHLLRWMTQHHDVFVLAYGDPGDPERIEKELGHPASRTEMVPIPRWIEDRWKRFGQLYALLRNTSFTEIASRNRGMQRALDRCLARETFDIIQIAYPVMGYFTFNSDAVRILDASNVEYDIHRRVAERTQSPVRKWWSTYEYRKLYPQEVAICREQDAILVTSERDRELMDRETPDVPKFIIANGVDTTYFDLPEETAPSNTLVFTGAMNYFPNADGITYFITEILPLIRRTIPDVTLYVVGTSPPESVARLASANVVVTGRVEDVRPYVRKAGVYVVPLRMGGGTRLKVLEALAMRRPIVTTSLGCEGIDVADGDSVLIADEPQSFADATIRLLRDAALRRTLVRRGHDLVRSRYDWSVIGVHLEEAYRQIVRRPAAEQVA